MNTELVRTSLTTSLVAGSLASFVAAKKAERATFMLVDCSYSMNDEVTLKVTKLAALRSIIANLKAEGVSCAMVGFGLSRAGSKGVDFIASVPDEALGSTPLTEAIDFAFQAGAGHLIVISDGEPNDPHSAMDAATLAGVPIDVFFVGEPGSSGEAFLTLLAHTTKGKCQAISLTNPKQLTSALRGLLTA